MLLYSNRSCFLCPYINSGTRIPSCLSTDSRAVLKSIYLSWHRRLFLKSMSTSIYLALVRPGFGPCASMKTEPSRQLLTGKAVLSTLHAIFACDIASLEFLLPCDLIFGLFLQAMSCRARLCRELCQKSRTTRCTAHLDSMPNNSVAPHSQLLVGAYLGQLVCFHYPTKRSNACTV